MKQIERLMTEKQGRTQSVFVETYFLIPENNCLQSTFDGKNVPIRLLKQACEVQR